MSSRYLVPAPAPPLEDAIAQLSARICASSNFRFAWQFFRFHALDPASPRGARDILHAMIENDQCHAFLRTTFDNMYDPAFAIDPIHSHAEVVTAQGAFENTLAAAANDHLGAYSHHLRDSTPAEATRVRQVFETIGPYNSFELIPGAVPNCPECSQHNNHLFSSWFFGVAWDWCFVVTWPKVGLAWVGCLTDTD